MGRKKLIKILTLICCGLVFVIGFSIGEKFFLRSSSKPQKQETPKVTQPKLQEKKLEEKEELILSSQEKEQEKGEVGEGKKRENKKEERVKEKAVEEKEEKKEELISPKKQTTKTPDIHIALGKVSPYRIQEEKKYKYKKQIFASSYKDKTLAIKRLLLREFPGVGVEIKPAEIEGKLIYRVILLSTTPEQIENVEKRIENLSKTPVVMLSKPLTKEKRIQIFATSDPDKADLIKKHLKELNYDVEVSKAELQPENIIYRIHLHGDEEKIIKQAQDIKENKIIEEIFKKPYLKKEDKEKEKKEEDIGKYIIQVASSTNPEGAESLLKQLREASKLPAYIKVVKMADRVEYKVRLVGFNDKETTMKFAQELLSKGVISSYIILKE